MLPDDIILNTQRAFDTSATSATGYGSLGAPKAATSRRRAAPSCVARPAGRLRRAGSDLPHGAALHPLRPDAQEAVPARRQRKTFDIQFDINNLFNNINFTPVFNPNSDTLFQTNALYTDINQSYDPGGRLGQIVRQVQFLGAMGRRPQAQATHD